MRILFMIQPLINLSVISSFQKEDPLKLLFFLFTFISTLNSVIAANSNTEKASTSVLECLAEDNDKLCSFKAYDLITGQFCSQSGSENHTLEGYSCLGKNLNQSAKIIAMSSTNNDCLEKSQFYKNTFLNKTNKNFSFEDPSNRCSDYQNFMKDYNNFREPEDYFFTSTTPLLLKISKNTKYVIEKVEATLSYSPMIDTNLKYALAIQEINDLCLKKQIELTNDKDVYFAYCHNSFTDSNSFSIENLTHQNGIYTATLSTQLYYLVSEEFSQKHPDKKIHTIQVKRPKTFKLLNLFK